MKFFANKISSQLHIFKTSSSPPSSHLINLGNNNLNKFGNLMVIMRTVIWWIPLYLLSLYCSVSFSLSLSLSFSLYIYLYFSVFLSLSISFSVFFSLSVFIFLSLFLCLCLSLSVFVCLCLSLSLFFCLYPKSLTLIWRASTFSYLLCV